MITLGEIRVTDGYYEDVSCKEEDLGRLDDERLKARLKEYCAVKGKDIEVLKFFIMRDGDGNIRKVWSLEVYYGPFGALIYLDNPWV
jgi:hypothetical protein